MAKNNCKHKRTRSGEPRAYTGGVAVHPYTDQEPRAAGGVTIRVTCLDCGAERRENHNRGYVEVGPWLVPDVSIWPGQWLVVANVSDGGRGDFVSAHDSKEFAQHAAARDGRRDLTVREAGKCETPRGCELEKTPRTIRERWG